MNYEHFAIWLHGFLEISNAESIDQTQTQIIKDHLALLFEKKTPIRTKKKDVGDLEDQKDYSISPLISELFTRNAISSTSNPCSEISLGEQFKGVDLNTKFDTELHKDKKYC